MDADFLIIGGGIAVKVRTQRAKDGLMP